MYFPPAHHVKPLLIISAALLAMGLIFLLVHPAGFNRSTSECTSRSHASITPATNYFSETIQKQTIQAIGGHPIEGFEPAMIMQAYPSLLPSDFECVQASQGRYAAKEGTVVFIPAGQNSVRSSAEQSITSYGMGTLLENLGKRLMLPFSTNQQVDTLLAEIAPITVSPIERVTLEGTYTCLPRKDTEGPQTLECALGIKDDDGSFYALDTVLLQSMIPPLQTGDRIRAQGILTPIERLSTDYWKRYEIKGIFSVTDSFEKK